MRLIDADKLLETFKEECIGNCEDCKHQCFGGGTTYCELIVIAPTVLHDNYSMGYQDGVRKVLSERPTGEWLEVVKYQFECDKCHYDDCAVKTNYCPNCGAKMEGAEE